MFDLGNIYVMNLKTVIHKKSNVGEFEIFLNCNFFEGHTKVGYNGFPILTLFPILDQSVIDCKN